MAREGFKERYLGWEFRVEKSRSESGEKSEKKNDQD